MYNFGGYPSAHSVLWCGLSSRAQPEWKVMDVVDYNFKGYRSREALVVENKIVYFGDSLTSRTLVLEEE